MRCFYQLPEKPPDPDLAHRFWVPYKGCPYGKNPCIGYCMAKILKEQRKKLLTSPVFGKLICEAKLLYGLLLDRMQLFVKNRWMDSEGKVYIYFSQEQIAGLMECGVKKSGAC